VIMDLPCWVCMGGETLSTVPCSAKMVPAVGR